MGNIDNESTKTNLFEPPIVAQYLRVIPVVCHKACTLRMELVGCELNGEGRRTPNYAILCEVQSLPVAQMDSTALCNALYIAIPSLNVVVIVYLVEESVWVKSFLLCFHCFFVCVS